MTAHPVETWHRLVRTPDPSGLSALLAEEVVFYSPVVHTPQRGRKPTVMYLSAAFQVLFNQGSRYVREIVGETDAMLEFETAIDGALVNGVDLIKWDESGGPDCRVQGHVEAPESGQHRSPVHGGRVLAGYCRSRHLQVSFIDQ